MRLEEAVKADGFASAQLEWFEVNENCFGCQNHLCRERVSDQKN